MEVVNTTSVNPEEYLHFLFKGDGLKKMIGSTSCACFVVTRPLDTPHFFEHLIENVTTIDSTTRQYVAFVVFYGKSTVYARASRYHEPYQFFEAQLDDISFSRCNDRFDEDYASLFRNQPQEINPNRFSQHMIRAADLLMDYFQLQEGNIPCLVFVDPDSIRHLIARLPGKDSFEYMYKYILAPLSDAFRDLQGWLSLKHNLLKVENDLLKFEEATEFLELASAKEKSLKDSLQVVKNELQSLQNQVLEDLPEGRSRKMKLAQDELSALNTQLEIIEQEVKECGETSAIILERKRKEIDKSLQAAKKELDQRTSKSLDKGYNWTEICRKLSPNNYCHSDFSVQAPKAYNVIEYILRNLPKDVDIATQLPNQNSEIVMNPPPKNGSHEFSASSPETRSPNNLWSFLRTIPSWFWLVFGVLIVGGIIYLISTGRGIVTIPGGGRIEPTQPNTKSSDSMSEQDIITVNYQCTWEGPGVTSQYVQSAEIIVKSQNGDTIPTRPPRTDRLGQVSFEMNKNDEVSISVRHDERSQFIQMPIVRLNKIEEMRLEDLENAVQRTDCVLNKK